MDIEHGFKRLRDSRNWNPLPPASQVTPPGRSHRMLSIAAVLLLVAGLATLWAKMEGPIGARHPSPSFTNHLGSVAGRPVPWIPKKAHAGAIRLRSRSDVPACQPRDLHVTTTAGGGAGGTYYVPATITSGDSLPCYLQESDLVIRWAAGQASIESTIATSRLMEPNGAQRYQIGYTSDCTTVPSSSQISFSPLSASLSGVDLSIDGPGVPDFVSSCSTALLAAEEPLSPEDAGVSPYSALDVAIEVAPGAIEDDPMKYMVTLTNTGPDTFRFSTCPAYVETLNIAGHVSTATYVLNCEGIDIAANASVPFAMQIQVPDGKGLSKLGWFMDDGPSTVTVITT